MRLDYTAFFAGLRPALLCLCYDEYMNSEDYTQQAYMVDTDPKTVKWNIKFRPFILKPASVLLAKKLYETLLSNSKKFA